MILPWNRVEDFSSTQSVNHALLFSCVCEFYLDFGLHGKLTLFVSHWTRTIKASVSSTMLTYGQAKKHAWSNVGRWTGEKARTEHCRITDRRKTTHGVLSDDGLAKKQAWRIMGRWTGKKARMEYYRTTDVKSTHGLLSDDGQAKKQAWRIIGRQIGRGEKARMAYYRTTDRQKSTHGVLSDDSCR